MNAKILMLVFGVLIFIGTLEVNAREEATRVAGDEDYLPPSALGENDGDNHGWKDGVNGESYSLRPNSDDPEYITAYKKAYKNAYERGLRAGEKYLADFKAKFPIEEAKKKGYESGVSGEAYKKPCSPECLVSTPIKNHWAEYVKAYQDAWEDGHEVYLNQPSKEYQEGFDKGFEDGLTESDYLPATGKTQDFYDGYHKGYFEAKAILLSFKDRLAKIGVDAYEVGYNKGLEDVRAGKSSDDSVTPPAADTTGIPNASLSAYIKVYKNQYTKSYKEGYAAGYDSVAFYITEEGDTFPKVKELPGGGKMIYYEDGRVEVKYGEGSLMWDPADPDKKVETTADGTVITWEKKFSDDSVTIWRTTDGRWCYDFADGGWAQVHDNGFWSRYDATRNVYWDSNGNYTYY